MTIKNVVVAGGGVLGSQIASQAAYKGFAVTVWLRSEGSVERAKPKFEQLRQTYLATLEAMKSDPAAYCRGLADTPELSVDEIEQLKQRAQQAFEGIVFSTRYEAAAKDADLVIEAIAEDPKQKDAFYAELAKYLPESTILVTNSSTLLPSQIAASTGRPEKFLALHFANRIWRNNTAEVMGQASTDPTRFDEMLEFANQIRMIALPVRKEKNGYLLNSMLVPWLLSALDLWASGVSDPKSIDIAWEHGTGAPKGPFRVIDTVGLNTAYNIVLQFQSVPGLLNPLFKKMMLPYNYKEMARLLKSMIDEGKLGMSSGEGFYSYE